MIHLNRTELRDKIYACWLGKNIGGTIGEPFEGKREILNVTGFTTRPGEPLPNDDLDLQLAWLVALEQNGPHTLNASVLAEYWLSHIPPRWNEYGICKANLKRGFLPPLSGEIGNDKWKHSNGAWIRSELWACAAPGFSGIARRYAFEDAIVDHGLGEGTFGEIFTATLESEAFVEKDIRRLIDTALEQIPETSKLYMSVRKAVECYDQGLDFTEARNRIVAMNEDLGWFMAPANIAFAVIGLLWGEGDFKKSILYAVNCGDDTDCTGATVGAILGIINGTAGIPTDWREYIGDRIFTKALNGNNHRVFPKTCTELTDRVMAMVPQVLTANGVKAALTDADTEYPEDRTQYGIPGKWLVNRPRWSVDYRRESVTCQLSYSAEPFLAGNETMDVALKITSKACLDGPAWVSADIYAPAGWTASCTRSTFMNGWQCVIKASITACENPALENVVTMVVRLDNHAETIAIPIVIGGK